MVEVIEIDVGVEINILIIYLYHIQYIVFIDRY